MFGPRLNFRMGRIVPFVEALCGRDPRFPELQGSLTPLSARSPASRLAYRHALCQFRGRILAAYGGGLDLPFGTHLAFRPIKLDYYMTRFQPVFIPGLGNANRNRNQNNLIYSVGFNFRF